MTHVARNRAVNVKCAVAVRTETFIFVGFILEGITPHVLAKLFAAAVNFTERLALWKCTTSINMALGKEYCREDSETA